MKIELKKTESNWPQSSLGCYISLDGTLLDVITPLNSPHEPSFFETPFSGTLKLVIRDMGRQDGYLGSVSIQTSLLQASPAPVTLPLFDSPSSDLLFQIPEASDMPRITLAVHKQTPTPVHAETKEAPHQTLPNALESHKARSQSPKKSLENEEKFQVLEIFHQEIENLHEEVLKEKTKNSALQEKYSELIETLKNNSARAQQRENSLLELMNEKEEKYCRNIEINLELQANVRRLEFEVKLMQEKVDKFELQEKYVRQLEEEIGKYQGMLQDVERNRDELTRTLVEKSLDGHYAKSLQVSIVDKAVALADRSDLNDKFIRKVIKKTMDRNIKPNQIIRIRDCLYKICNVEVSLAICDDGVYTKCGNKLMTLSEYWKKINRDRSGLEVRGSFEADYENEKFHSINRSLDSGITKRSSGLKFDARSFASILSKRN